MGSPTINENFEQCDERMKTISLAILALMAALPSTAMAGIPVDSIVAPLQEHANISQQEIERRVAEHIMQGNLTNEHLSQDLNATKEQLREQAVEHINQSLNITSEQLQQMAKEELQNQVDQKVQQPGFEYVFALTGILGAALLMRKWH
jgi:formate dehydrogenase maturation protein FdhE